MSRLHVVRFAALLIAAAVSSITSAAAPAKAAKPAAKAPRYALKVVTDRPGALYRVGDTASFTVTLTRNGKPASGVELAYTLDKDGWGQAKSGKLTTSAEPLTITGTLAEPGFLRCTLRGKTPEGQDLTAMGGAGFDPHLIKPSLGVPEDFDAFWAAQKAELAKVAMNPRLTPVAAPAAEGVEAFDVQLDCVGKGVSGYFARPKGAAPRSLPAVLHVHGAGVRSSILASALLDAQSNRLGMDINAHGIANGKDAAFYAALNEGELRDYRFAGREDRRRSYFTGMFLRLQRALDFLTAQPEWDGKILIVAGSSQGGYQAIVAGGLDRRVTAIAAGVPAGCDHSGNAADRIAGWPKLVPLVDHKPDAQVLQASRYVDAMNFATRFKGAAIVSVGFIDATCPPTTVYAAYNNLAGPKQMVNEPLMGHANNPSVRAAFTKFIDAQAAKK